MDDPRPRLTCLVVKPALGGDCYVGVLGLPLLNGEREARECIVALEDAYKFIEMGWVIFVDPADEAELARWEQLHQQKKRPRWNQW
jgi:hypothetical protein